MSGEIQGKEEKVGSDSRSDPGEGGFLEGT